MLSTKIIASIDNLFMDYLFPILLCMIPLPVFFLVCTKVVKFYMAVTLVSNFRYIQNHVFHEEGKVFEVLVQSIFFGKDIKA